MSEDEDIICLDSGSESESEDKKEIITPMPKLNPVNNSPEVITLDDSESENEDDKPELNPYEKRTKLFVNYLPQDLSDEEFNNLFLEVGPIKESFIFREKITNYSYGYGIVDYECPEDAARGIRDYHNFSIRPGKQLKVVYSRETNGGYSNLYFCNAGEGVSEAEMRQIFQPIGEIIQFKLLKNQQGQSLGKGFVRFANRFQAILAIKSLHDQKTTSNGSILSVQFAEEHGKAKAPIYYDLVKKAKKFKNQKSIKARLGTKRPFRFQNKC